MIRILLFLISLSTVSAGLSAEVTAKADRLEIFEDESFILTVTVSPSGTLNQTDISALESIFTILSRGQSTQSSTINGQRTSVTEYQFRLAPKEKGMLGIPAFTVNGQQSDSFFINVKDASTRTHSLEDDAIQYDVSINNAAPYIDQTIQLTIEIAYRIGLNGQFTNLNFPNFETGEQQEQQRVETRQGKSYNVYSLTIPLTPRHAGEFTLPDIVFRGQYQVSSNQPAKRISLSAKPDKITVKPIPTSYPAGAYWLPVQDLTITDNLASELILETGEHVNWSITQTVKGVSANILPDPLSPIESHPNIQLYRDKPIFEDTKNNLGSRKDISALSLKITNESQIEIPEIRIPWWNITTDQLEFAVLPKKTLSIKPKQEPATNSRLPIAQPANLEASPIVSPNAWFQLALASVLTLSLCVNFWLYRKLSKPMVATPKEGDVDSPQVDNVADAYSILLKLVRHHSDSIAHLKQQLGTESSEVINSMEAHYFGQTHRDTCSATQAKQVITEATKHYKKKLKGKQPSLSVYPSP